MPPGDTAACIALTNAADFEAFEKSLDDDGDGETTRLCPKAALIEQVDGKPKPRVTPLSIDEGSLADPSDCCGADSVEVAARGGKVLLRVTGADVRDCYGGTATTDLDTTYRLDGKRLVVTDEASVGTH